MEISPKMLPQIGTETFPIRCSLLVTLFSCPRSFVAKTILDGMDEAGEPAQTGSLIHLGIQTYHNTKGSKSAAMVILQQGKEKLFQLANLERSIEHVTNYIQREKEDPRGKIIHSEVSVQIRLKPAKIDPTKKEIIINGTIDQIRQLGDWFWVLDFKTGFKPGEDMVDYYTPQLAGYLYAASQYLKTRKNIKAFICRTEDLKSRRYPYFWEMPFDVDKAEKILDTVRTRIAVIRSGHLETTAGKPHCGYCEIDRYYPGCIDNTGQVRAPKDGNTARKPLKTVSELFKV